MSVLRKLFTKAAELQRSTNEAVRDDRFDVNKNPALQQQLTQQMQDQAKLQAAMAKAKNNNLFSRPPLGLNDKAPPTTKPSPAPTQQLTPEMQDQAKLQAAMAKAKNNRSMYRPPLGLNDRAEEQRRWQEDKVPTALVAGGLATGGASTLTAGPGLASAGAGGGLRGLPAIGKFLTTPIGHSAVKAFNPTLGGVYRFLPNAINAASMGGGAAAYANQLPKYIAEDVSRGVEPFARNAGLTAGAASNLANDLNQNIQKNMYPGVVYPVVKQMLGVNQSPLAKIHAEAVREDMPYRMRSNIKHVVENGPNWTSNPRYNKAIGTGLDLVRSLTPAGFMTTAAMRGVANQPIPADAEQPSIQERVFDKLIANPEAQKEISKGNTDIGRFYRNTVDTGKNYFTNLANYDYKNLYSRLSARNPNNPVIQKVNNTLNTGKGYYNNAADKVTNYDYSGLYSKFIPPKVNNPVTKKVD